MGFELLLQQQEDFHRSKPLSERQLTYIEQVYTTRKELISRPDFYLRVFAIENDTYSGNNLYFESAVRHQLCQLADRELRVLDDSAVKS